MAKRSTLENLLTIEATEYPAQLQALPRWSTWKKATRDDGSKYKLPLSINGWRAASSTDPKHWGDYDDAHIKNGHPTKLSEGLAFALFAEDNLTCFDFDHVDEMTQAQQKAIAALCKITYSEISQSGRGIHCFFMGGDDRILRKRFDWLGIPIEIYRDKRFIALTGWRVPGSPPNVHDYDAYTVEKCLGELPTLAREQIETMSDAARDEPATISTKKLLKLIKRESEFDKDARFVISTIKDGGNNDSDADYVFCKTLFRFGAVYGQALDIVLDNNLRTDSKWDRDDYQAATLSRALAATQQEQVDKLSDFDDMSHAKAVKKQEANAYKDLEKRDAQECKRLDKMIEELQSITAKQARAAMGGRETKAKGLAQDCRELSEKINAYDVQRMNRKCGLVSTSKTLRYALYHAGGLRSFAQREYIDALRDESYYTGFTVMAKGALKLRVGYSAHGWPDSKEKLKFPGAPVMRPSPKIFADTAGFKPDAGKKPFNLFQGCMLKPFDTGVSAQPIYDHILKVWACGDVETAEYILNWFARMVQKPHLQAETAIALKSMQGVGKSKITDIFGKYFGQHFLDSTDIKDLTGFNDKAASSVMIVMNEATFGGSKKDEGVLKKFITDDTLICEGKFVDQLTVNNCVHMMLLTNNSWAVPVGLDDRRFVVLDCSSDHMDERRGGQSTRGEQAAYFEALVDNCIKAGGDITFLYELLRRDISDYDPRDRPKASFENDARREQEYRGLDIFQRWFLDCAEQGGFSLGGEVVIDWHEDEPIKISISDIKMAFTDSRLSTNRAGDVPFKIKSELNKLLLGSEYFVKDEVNTASQLSGNKVRGRGCLLPPRRAFTNLHFMGY